MTKALSSYYQYEFKNSKWGNLSTSDSKEYFNFITKIFDTEDVLDLSKFISGISSYFDKFQENYSKSNSYQQQGKIDFNYKWSEFFTIKDVIHNSNIVVNSEPTSILIKHGIILSPWITFPIGLENIQEFLSEM